MRLSLIAAQKFGLSRRYVKTAIKAGLFRIDGRITKKDEIVCVDSLVEYLGDQKNVSFNIDDFLILKNDEACFIYKPPFMHSERLRPTDKLTAGDIWETLPDYSPLSRLDYEADGVVGAIRKNTTVNVIEKKYLAIVEGGFPERLTLSNKIDADKTKKVSVLDDDGGYHTIMQKISYNGQYSLISVTLSRAARHQVRAFCAYLGHPILGDKLYGGHTFQRLCLHCEKYTINGNSASSGKYLQEFCDLVDFKGKI